MHNQLMDNFYVKAEWDGEAGVWYVAETNVPGLCTEAATADELFAKLDVMVPELVAINRGVSARAPFELIAHRQSNNNHCH